MAPLPFDWVLVLNKAGKLLPVPFEKQAHAKVKYGDENYFSPMYGGRSLRATAEQVIYKLSNGVYGVGSSSTYGGHSLRATAEQMTLATGVLCVGFSLIHGGCSFVQLLNK